MNQKAVELLKTLGLEDVMEKKHRNYQEDSNKEWQSQEP